MPTDYWRVTDFGGAALPNTILAWILLLCYGALFLALLVRDRAYLRHLSLRQSGIILFLSGLAFILSRLFPTHISTVTAHLASFDVQSISDTPLALLSAVPYLLAGALMGPTAALIVGFFTGLGRTLGLPYLLYDPFNFAFAAWIASWIMEQNYHGHILGRLRSPLTSGIISQLIILLLTAFVAFVSVEHTVLTALDIGSSEFLIYLWPMLLEGIISGLVVTLIVNIWHRGQSPVQKIPSPPQRNIRHNLLANYLLFALVVFSLGTLIMLSVSMFLVRRLQVAQMTAFGNEASTQIFEYQSKLEDELVRFANEDAVRVQDKAQAARELGRLFRAAETFQRVMLVSDERSITYAYPPEVSGSVLTEEENLAVPRVKSDGGRQRIVSNISDSEQILSIIIPVYSDSNQTSILIGRVPLAEFSRIIDVFGENDGPVSSYIVDRDGQVVTHANSINSVSERVSLPLDGEPKLDKPGDLAGEAFLYRNQDRSRDLIFIAPRTAHAWQVAMVVPYGAVIGQSLLFALPLIAALFMVATVFYFRLDRYGRSLSVPISELARTSRLITKGGSPTTYIHNRRYDEIGDLSHAFTGMQLALKGRLEELSLLLNVSKDISSSNNITQSMTVILKGALRGTGAAGARALILNPSGKTPLSFTEGPSGADLVALDRPLMTLLRENDELALGSPRQMQAVIGLVQNVNEPINALYALPLKSNHNFLGILFLGFRQSREFSPSERTLLHTLAGQATVLVDNAYLFANAESGRRRLAAVLASTTEAVIVTDQSDRILIINRAMERAFQLSFSRVRGRAIADVIESKKLVAAFRQGR